MEKTNTVTVRTTGKFELRDPISDVTIGWKAVEVPETSFVTQYIALKRLEVTSGKVTQETEVSNHNPQTEPLPVKDSEPTIKELTENVSRGRGRPPKSE